jgi:hypothetical protein
VKAPRLQDSRLPPLTWNDLAQPTPLTPDEEELPLVRALAHRFNPAMALPTKDIWPVEVRYAWHDGSPLKARVVSTQGRVLREYVALPHERLAANDWDDLPTEDEDGNRIDYYVDAPGDDRVEDNLSGWRRPLARHHGQRRQGRPRGRRAYKPTQYVHFFWFNRDKGLLAIQYWFYYPYNEWINHHEGDWERHQRGGARPHAAHRERDLPSRRLSVLLPPLDVRARAGGAHRRHRPTRGSRGGVRRRPQQVLHVERLHLRRQLPLARGVPRRRRRRRPLPSRRRHHETRALRAPRGVLARAPARARSHRRGPEPRARLAAPLFFAGQPHMYRNPLALNTLSFGGAPQQPARQTGWNGEWHPPYWADKPQFDAHALKLPKTWQAVVEPPLKAYEAVAARRPRLPPVPPVLGRGP